MAKHTWQKGEVITAEKLNNLENRAGGGLVVRWDSTGTDGLDKTWQEIHDAFENGMAVTIVGAESDEFQPAGAVCACVKNVNATPTNYQVQASYWTGSSFDFADFISNSPDGTLTRVGD